MNTPGKCDKSLKIPCEIRYIHLPVLVLVIVCGTRHTFPAIEMLCDVSNTGYLSSDTYWAVCYHLSLSFYQLPLSLSHTCIWSVSYSLVFFLFCCLALWINKFEHTCIYTLVHKHNDYVHYAKLKISVHILYMILYMFDFGEPICYDCNVDLCSYGSALTVAGERNSKRARARITLVEKIKKNTKGKREYESHWIAPHIRCWHKNIWRYKRHTNSRTSKLMPTFKSAQFAVNKINIHWNRGNEMENQIYVSWHGWLPFASHSVWM